MFATHLFAAMLSCVGIRLIFSKLFVFVFLVLFQCAGDDVGGDLST